MKKKLTRVAGDASVGLDEETQVDVPANDEAPVSEAEVERRFRESAEKIVAKHAGLFRRLSK